MLPVVEEQKIGRRLVHDHAHALTDLRRPEVPVLGPFDLMQLPSRLRRIELQIEPRRLPVRCSSPFSLPRLSVKVSAMRNCMRSGFVLKRQSLQPLQPVPKVRARGADRSQVDLEGGEGTHQTILVYRQQRPGTHGWFSYRIVEQGEHDNQSRIVGGAWPANCHP